MSSVPWVLRAARKITRGPDVEKYGTMIFDNATEEDVEEAFRDHRCSQEDGVKILAAKRGVYTYNVVVDGVPSHGARFYPETALDLPEEEFVDRPYPTQRGVLVFVDPAPTQPIDSHPFRLHE